MQKLFVLAPVLASALFNRQEPAAAAAPAAGAAAAAPAAGAVGAAHPAVVPVLEPSAKCAPVCSWKCDNPACEETCTPVCAAPVCKTFCEDIQQKSCNVFCKPPKCAVICPASCTAQSGCPQCKTVCSNPECETRCQTDCLSKCANPVCSWDCSKPKHCPKPSCSLSCKQCSNPWSGGDGSVVSAPAGLKNARMMSAGQAHTASGGALGGNSTGTETAFFQLPDVW